MPKQNNNQSPFWNHIKGLWADTWNYFLGIVVVIILIIWLILANTNVEGLVGKAWYGLANGIANLIIAGFEPLPEPGSGQNPSPERPADQPEPSDCDPSEGICHPDFSIPF